MPLILALARHGQEDLCEHEPSPVYIVRPGLKKQKPKQTNTNQEMRSREAKMTPDITQDEKSRNLPTLREQLHSIERETETQGGCTVTKNMPEASLLQNGGSSP